MPGAYRRLYDRFSYGLADRRIAHAVRATESITAVMSERRLPPEGSAPIAVGVVEFDTQYDYLPEDSSLRDRETCALKLFFAGSDTTPTVTPSNTGHSCWGLRSHGLDSDERYLRERR